MPLQLNPLMENNLTLYGASGHAKVIIDILCKNHVTINCIMDDNPKSDHILGFPVLKTAEVDHSKLTNVIIAIGNNRVRKLLSKRISVFFPTAIHPTAVVSQFAVLGGGTVVMAGSLINPDSRIGTHCIINTGSIVEHDCLIGDFVHISPGVSLAGGVSVGEGAHVGIGATVIQGVSIGKWAVIGAGAVIIHDVPDYAVVVGIPGKILKYNKE